MSFEGHALDSALHIFRSLKATGDRALEQLDLGDLLWTPGNDTNSIAIILRHLHGNMMSRWTDFLLADGEKPWRDRDSEFEQPSVSSREELIELWEQGWACLFQAIDALHPDNMASIVTIRGQEHTVMEALHRQMQHVSYHLGQIVMLARMRKGAEWQTLSIARGASRQYRPGGGLGEAERKG